MAPLPPGWVAVQQPWRDVRAATLSLPFCLHVQLVSDEEVGDFMAPEEQRAQRGGAGMASSTGSQYDADAGSGAASAERYSLGGKKGQHGNGQHGNGRGGRAGDSNGGHVGPGSGGGGEPSGYQAQGRQLGELMRHKVQEEGWQFVVEGHRCAAQHAPALPKAGTAASVCISTCLPSRPAVQPWRRGGSPHLPQAAPDLPWPQVHRLLLSRGPC